MAKSFGNIERIRSAGEALSEQDKEQERRSQAREERGSYPLARILDREQNTRQLKAAHVAALVQSIADLGLIEPLVIDRRGRLLAGGHRLEALRTLAQEMPDRFRERFPDDTVPARIFDIDADAQPDVALGIEVAENTNRRDYTVDEVRDLAKRLKAAGYRDAAGRPSDGEKALKPALSVIVGKSYSTIRRALKGSNDEQPGVSSTTALRRLQRAVAVYRDATGKRRSPHLKRVAEQLDRLETALTKALEAEEE